MRKLYIHPTTKEVLHVSAFPETDLKDNVFEGTEVECITEHTEGFDWGDTWTPPPPPHIPTFDEKLYTTKKELFKALQEAHHELLCETLPDELTREQIEHILIHGIKPVGSQFWQKWEYTYNDSYYALPETGGQDGLPCVHANWSKLDFRQTHMSKSKARDFIFNVKDTDTHIPNGAPHWQEIVYLFMVWKPVNALPPYGVWERISGEGFLRFKDDTSEESFKRDGNSVQADNIRLHSDWREAFIRYDDHVGSVRGAGWIEKWRDSYDAVSGTGTWGGYVLTVDYPRIHGYRATGGVSTFPINQFAWKLYERKA